MPDNSTIAIGISITGFLTGLAIQYFGFVLRFEKEITALQTKMDFIWRPEMLHALSSLVKQPIHFRKDELMDMLIPPTEEGIQKVQEMSIDDMFELKTILKEEMIELKRNKDPKVLAYALVLSYLEQKLYDRGCR